MDITLVIAIIGCIIGIMSFFFARKDSGEKKTENSSFQLGTLVTKMDFLSEQIKILSDKFDKYDTEVDEKIQKEINAHVLAYHKKE